MNKVLTIIFLIITVCCTTVPAIKSDASEYDLYITRENFIWREFDNNTRLLKESGPIYGAGFTAKGNILKSFTLKSRLEFFYGIITYDGQTQDGTPSETDTDYTGIKAEIDGGCRILSKYRSSLEPFIGLGARLWERDIRSNAGALGYAETWSSIYARLGIRGDHTFPDSFNVFAEAALKIPIDNKNEVDGSQFGTEDFSLDPGNRLSVSTELGIKWNRLEAGVFYESLRFSESNPVTAGNDRFIQPESEADIFGLNVGISF